MIYFVGLIAGFVNGFFASGAGQLIVFYLIFILKIDSHIGRSVSIGVLCISSIFSIYGYSKFIDFEISKIITIIIIAAITGIVGSKIMNKVDSKILNLISGIVVTSLAIYGLCR